MNINPIKNIVQNYKWATNLDIEEIIEYIITKKTNELGIEIEFYITYDEGAVVKNERTEDGKLQLQIGILPFYEVREKQEKNEEFGTIEERKEFIELILSTFHELRHIEQINNVIDNPTYNENNFKITRELIINELFPFIFFNYETSVSEIDAMKTSLLNTIEFFQNMESDIEPNEIFEVMKEKELKYLNYNLENFGSNYKTALNYFETLYGQQPQIKNYEKMLDLLPQEIKVQLHNQCYDLQIAYYTETDIEEKLNTLMNLALTIMPKLYQKYPLLELKNNKRK